jgi:adenosylcobinamide kinase / adenosylcobinamide-phosphate guanylyltransferase
LKKIILLLGGARSGKSYLAQQLAREMSDRVLFVATATGGDEDMRLRIERHRQDRPASWRTLEAETNIGPQITKSLGESHVVIVDCITLLVNNLFSRYDEQQFESIPDDVLLQAVTSEIKGLQESMEQADASFIIVSNEVGLGLVPANRIGRLYRDCLGRANQMLAQIAGEVFFLVSGIPLRIKPP